MEDEDPDVEHSSLAQAESLVQSWLGNQGLVQSCSMEATSHGKPITYDQQKLSWPDLNIGNRHGRLPRKTSLFLRELELGGGEHPSDYVSSLDWNDGCVGESVRAVLKGLMETEVNVPRTCNSRKRDCVRDPSITMDMRHKQVRERRRAREESRKKALERELLSQEASRHAMEEMKKEEETRKLRTRMEEKAIQHHMVAIRRQMSEQKHRERLLRKELEARELANVAASRQLLADSVPDGCGHVDRMTRIGTIEGAAGSSSTCSNKRRCVRETRAALVQQLAESEALEMKQKLLLLYQCFTSWRSVVDGLSWAMKRAAAVADWHLMLRCWKGWREVVRESHTHRSALLAAQRLRKERQKRLLAERNYNLRLTRCCFDHWMSLVKAARLHHDQHVHFNKQKDKLETFLTAVAERDKEKTNEHCMTDIPTSQRVEGFQSNTLKTNKVVTLPVCDREDETYNGKQPVMSVVNEEKSQTKVGVGLRKENRVRVWSDARKHVDALLAQGAKQMRRSEQSVSDGSSNVWAVMDCDIAVKQTRKVTSPTPPPPQAIISQNECTVGGGYVPARSDMPVTTASQCTVGSAAHSNRDVAVPSHQTSCTRPLLLKAMEERTARIAQRKAAREERNRRKEEERLVQLRAEQEEKKKEEKELRKAMARQKREELRLAQQREVERQVYLTKMAALARCAMQHYHKSLLVRFGLDPWKKLVAMATSDANRADRLFRWNLIRHVWLSWMKKTRIKIAEREQKAHLFWQRRTLSTAIAAWKKYVANEHHLMTAASTHHLLLLRKKAFRGWTRVTNEERVLGWERERRARKHYERVVLTKLLLSWRRFVPLSREERRKEVRRAELRRKVAQWLPDYLPESDSQD